MIEKEKEKKLIEDRELKVENGKWKELVYRKSSSKVDKKGKITGRMY
jgi:hypothetical protein